jgi:hypothetical protein
MRSRLSLVAAILSVMGTPLSGASSWLKNPFPEWSRDDVLRLLTDSPWAKSETLTFDFKDAVPGGPVTWKDLGVPGSGQAPTVQGGSPVGGIGAPRSKDKIDADINVRWSSALPVRRARALTQFGPDGLESEAAREVLAPDEKFYVLEVSGVPAAVAFHGLEAMQADLYRTVRLTTGSRRSLAPDSVYVAPRGVTLNVTFRFSRTRPITAGDKKLELRIDYGLLKLRREWKLSDMAYDGKLEL